MFVHRLILIILVLVLMLSGCTTSPPSRSDDVCVIFAEKNGWYDDARKAEARWGTPVSTLMAFIRHESGFRADAKPARRWYLGFIPGFRPSDAYGYPQALDSTWRDYKRSTGQRWADRDDFTDAVDFIGWYNDISYRKNGIAKTDAYNLYLAYHEGHGGYNRQTYRGKSWLQRTANRVSATAGRYRQQLRSCRQQW